MRDSKKKKRKIADDSMHAPEFVQDELAILRFWDSEHIFKKALERTKHGKPFIFYEGPPTANGRPGIHHVLARVFKDVIIRFQTLQGRYVERRAGWDTHGLPVEISVEKELGISGKKDIENIVPSDKRASIAEFNARCKENVMSLITDWEQMTRRIGYWLDFENDYRTYRNDYIETLWWIIKQMSEIQTSQGPLLYEGHKVVTHCPRCETSLSSHEVAQGYKTVQDISVFVKFKITKTNLLKAQSLLESGKNVSILSWTTTPWTLPGNVALAVDPKLAYVLVKYEDGYLILAKDRLESVLGEKAVLDLEFRGEDLLKSSYEPLFQGSVDASGHPNAWTVLPAAFVSADEGTGVVHTAVMYGEDDYELGKQAKLPTQHTVTRTGHFTDSVQGFAGQFVKAENTEKALLDFLHSTKSILRVEPYSHEYPFCWRCNTPLLYYAKDSWFVRMSALRKELKANNARINWIPEHLRDGRFGEWLDEAKDWAFSRERYWGTSLPIWKCTRCGTTEFIGSYSELNTKAVKESLPQRRKTIVVMRHGEAESNVHETISSDPENTSNDLTPQGIKTVTAVAKKLKGKIDLIISSDFIRTKHSAQIIAKETQAEITFDTRLREYRIPSYEGKKVKDFLKEFPESRMRIHDAPEGGETLLAAAHRMNEAVIDSIQQYKDKRLLFLSHGDVIWAYRWLLSGKADTELERTPYLKTGESASITVNDIRINPHRPYVDDIELPCTCKRGAKKKRVEEVADVWFDSGSMPFAQDHYPFEHTDAIDKGSKYPSEYISEAIDQTRGWFYTLLAVSTVLGKGAPYKNVISLGHILDEKGEKMSKSKGNVVDPWVVISETGADALRFHFYSMNRPGDVKLFHVDGVREVIRKIFMIAWNVQSFYLLHAKKSIIHKPPKPDHALDRWLLAELEHARAHVTDELSAFHVFEASRLLREFVQQLSTWYVRRSRTRLRHYEGGSQQTLGYVLWVLVRLFAPFTPLFAEQLFLRMKGSDPLQSVHLAEWPKDSGFANNGLRKEMADARDAVELFHSIRKEQGIRSRQPLQEGYATGSFSDELREIMQEEVNADTIKAGNRIPTTDGWVQKSKGSLTVALNCAITPELKERGEVRELIRNINDLRKLARLTPHNTILLFVKATSEIETFVTVHQDEIQAATRTASIHFDMPSDIEVTRTVKIGTTAVVLALRVQV